MASPTVGGPLTYTHSTDDGVTEHTGIVWSEGPCPSTVWVQPDADSANPVLVRLPTPARAARGDQPMLDAGYPATWQRDVVRRCDSLRRFGSVYCTRRPLGRYGSSEMWEYVQHADPDCDSAAGLTGGPSDWTFGQVLDVLLDRYTGRPPKLCSRCILLDHDAPLRAAS